LLERIEQLLEQRVMLIRQPGDVLSTIAGSVDKSAALRPVFAAVIEALADHRPRTLAEIEDVIGGPTVTVPQLCEAIGALVNLDAVTPVQDESAVQSARARTDKLNALLCAKAIRGADVRVLASPVTGTGYGEVGGRIALFFLHGIARGVREPRDLGAQALHIFRTLGIGLFRDGRPIESAEESLALLTNQAQYFVDRQLPALRAMQIAA
jgi:hypothetical protein